MRCNCIHDNITYNHLMLAEILEIFFQLLEFENHTRERSMISPVFILPFIILFMLTMIWCIYNIDKWNIRYPGHKFNSAYFDAHRSLTPSSHGLRSQQQDVYFYHKEKVTRSWVVGSCFFGPNFAHLSRLDVAIVMMGKTESSARLGVTPGGADKMSETDVP